MAKIYDYNDDDDIKSVSIQYKIKIKHDKNNDFVHFRLLLTEILLFISLKCNFCIYSRNKEERS